MKLCQQYIACASGVTNAVVKNNKPFIQCSSYPIEAAYSGFKKKIEYHSRQSLSAKVT